MVDEALMQGFNSIAELRESELRCAAGVLGLAGVSFMGWRDSGMPGTVDNEHPQALVKQPVSQVAAQVANHIRRIQPQVVVTFDPIGGYKHPDHIHIHLATVQAFQMAADPAWQTDLPPYQAARLYYSVMPRGLFKVAVRLMPLLGMNPRRFGRNKDIDLVDLAQAGDFPVHAYIDYRSVLDLRDEAHACHASQLPGGMSRGPARWIRSLLGTYDHFMRAYPPAPKGLRESDLFQGL
jgi:LmbE family N-acetylglucosaminyl deacetylase